MTQENTLRTYQPDARILLDLLEISEKYNLDIYEFEAELAGVTRLLKQFQAVGLFEDMKDIVKSMRTAIKSKFGE